MNVFVKCFVFFVLAIILACSGRVQITKEEGINALLPPDTMADTPREYSKDVLRSDGQFNFNTLLTTDLTLDLTLYDGSSVPSQQLTMAMVRAGEQTGLEVNATVIIRNASSKQILFAGKTDADGHLDTCLHLPAHISNVTLSIIKNKFNERTIIVDDITKFSKINRGIGLLKSQDSVLNNALKDSDGDQIPDFYDAFPTDPTRAFRYFVPADEYLSVAFEDNFPNLGDGDYNDFLARYRIERISNSANSIVEINGDVNAVAKLAGYDHRFGIFINFPGSRGTLQVTNKNHSGFNISTRTLTVIDQANVVLFERTASSFTDGKGHGAYFRILFNEPASADNIDAIPFDPYLYVHNTGFDVHLLGESSLPDTHNPPGSDGFRDLNGFPRGLLVPTNWYYPKEGRFIEAAYPKFLNWRTSMGQDKSDWFLYPVEDQTVTASNEFADRPTVVLPGNMNPSMLQITPEGLSLPDKLGGSYVPVGKVYNVTMTNGQNNFGTDLARIEFYYSKSALQSAGLLQEFQVFFFDNADSKWKPVSKVIVDEATQKVTAFTNHFTPFVLTAAPTGGGNVPSAPACINADFPSGIGGSGAAKFSLVDENFKYYQDRDYFIQAINAPSPENAATFTDLGFEGAMGISTCNGQPPGSCGPQASHKMFAGTDYINFTAHTNIDVYVMYDTRGGAGRNDVSLDANWLTAKGFTVDIKGDGGTAPDYFVETTDAVRYYAVYKKSYVQGQVVSLDGNKLGAGDPAINTNYWVIVKPAGNTTPNSATSLCVATPDTNPPAKISNLQAIPGATKVTLRWQNPIDPDFAGVVIRRSTSAPPADINEGAEPLINTVFSTESFRDDSVLTATTYFYTVFALDANNNRQLGESVMVVTGTDGDNDGLTDAYENAFVYPTALKSNSTIFDTDGDGISDGVEVGNGTDPTNGDVTKPAISAFSATSPTITANANVTFTLNATDNVAVTSYMITLSGTPPSGNNSNWGPLPGNFVLPATMGMHTLYAWAKDAAGNVSNVFAGLTFTLVPVPPVSVISTAPADGSTGVGMASTISVTFSEPMNPTTITTTVSTNCVSGSIQISADNFASCVPMRAATPTLSGGNTVATFSPAPSTLMTPNMNYKIRVTANAQSANNVALNTYVASAGFLIRSNTAIRVYGQAGSFVSGEDNNGGVSADSLISARGVAVDATGAYIVDQQNHRVLHYSGSSITADRVYGQPSFTTNLPNNGGLSGSTLFSPVAVSANSGGVFIVDSGNNRVLHFSGISTNADRVYGQPDFNTGNVNSNGLSANSLSSPADVGADGGGVYIADHGNRRLLHYSGGATTADRVYGQAGSFSTNVPNIGGISADSLNGAFGLAIDTTGIYISDAGNCRVLHYSGVSTTADRVYGQFGSFTANICNNGGVSSNSFNVPSGLAADATGIYVVDWQNNRVLHYSGTATTADRVYGQGGSFISNLINNGGITADSLHVPQSIAVDSSGVYIGDSGNRRALHYSGISTSADRVYGQLGIFSTNSPLASAESLLNPTQIAGDLNGIYVVDQLARVLHYSGTSSTADRVYGQFNSFSGNTANNGGISANSLGRAAAVAVDSIGVYISDYANHRVLHYSGASTTADRVYGQPSFITGVNNNGGISATSLSYPTGLVADGAGGLYIADTGNLRVLHYNGASVTADRVYGNYGNFTIRGAVNTSRIYVGTPPSMAVDATGVYIVDTGSSRVLHYSGTSTIPDRVYGQIGSFDTDTANKGGVSADSLFQPQGVALDGTGVYIADTYNHRVLHFSGVSTTADHVYGQPGFTTNTANNGGTSAKSLCFPTGIAINSNGIHVVDSFNFRVLVY